jgi:hypothetical protein
MYSWERTLDGVELKLPWRMCRRLKGWASTLANMCCPASLLWHLPHSGSECGWGLGGRIGTRPAAAASIGDGGMRGGVHVQHRLCGLRFNQVGWTSRLRLVMGQVIAVLEVYYGWNMPLCVCEALPLLMQEEGLDPLAGVGVVGELQQHVTWCSCTPTCVQQPVSASYRG